MDRQTATPNYSARCRRRCGHTAADYPAPDPPRLSGRSPPQTATSPGARHSANCPTPRSSTGSCPASRATRSAPRCARTAGPPRSRSCFSRPRPRTRTTGEATDAGVDAYIVKPFRIEQLDDSSGSFWLRHGSGAGRRLGRSDHAPLPFTQHRETCQGGSTYCLSATSVRASRAGSRVERQRVVLDVVEVVAELERRFLRGSPHSRPAPAPSR